MPYKSSKHQASTCKNHMSILEAPAVRCKNVVGCKQSIQEAIAWQKVPRQADASCKYNAAPLPDLRFFLRGKDSLQELYK